MSPAGRFGDLVLEVLGEQASEGRAAASSITSWIDAVASWNQQMDLTAARDDRELVDLMVADAAVLAAAVGPPSGDRRRTVVDVGSGAGPPGLPLGLLRADLEMTLVEPKQKRAALLRMTLGRLGSAAAQGGETAVARPRIQVLQARGEAVQGRFDVALSRATLAPPAWLELGAKLAPDGDVWVLLAREDAPELEGWHQVRQIAYRWPLTGAERRAVCYRVRSPAPRETLPS
ncbi:MAG: class I SAM-dependent methyltransferase [Deltaproteobacteria bacterium]|nr:class I SAM-dependent methyltransferase [Deltaproteobacteria bacterium]